MNRNDCLTILAGHPATDTIDAIERLAEIGFIANAYHRIFGWDDDDVTPTVFTGTLTDVTTFDRGTVTKCRLTLDTQNDEPETIDTDPLDDPWATHLRHKATTLIGQQVLIVKRNTPDPS